LQITTGKGSGWFGSQHWGISLGTAMLAIGIDFGTTNCSASIYRGGRVELIPLEEGRFVLPSTLCITKDHQVHFGRRAIEYYLAVTRETRIRYRFTDLRTLTSAFQAEIEESPMIESEHGLVIVSDVGEEEDLDRPARLFQSLKTGLRDPNFHGTTVYDRYYAMEELIALVLRHIREAAERYLGEPVHAAVVGRPVTYAPLDRPSNMTAEQIDRTAHERMLVAARLAGFKQAALEFEPVAAERHLRAALPDHAHALVFDFGGGTLDLALSRVVSSPHSSAATDTEIIATKGITLGGDDFDSAIMRHALLKHFGHGTTLGPKNLPFPPNLLDPLLHWQSIPLLATPANVAHIAAIKRQSNAPQTIENLQTLILRGLGFQLYQLIESAKIALSFQTETCITMREEGLTIDERLTRGEFVEAISEHLAVIRQGISQMLSEAMVSPREVDVVLMTGGSSLVPVVQNMLRHLFGPARVRAADPFTSIVAGLGIIAAQDDICQALGDITSEATGMRMGAEAVTIGETVTFFRGAQPTRGTVARRAGGRLHDAILVIEYWDGEIEQFVSTMRHETKVQRIGVAP
jgi:hypothetical chaperone protein